MKDYRKRYERITKSELFKETYHNKSLGMDEKTEVKIKSSIEKAAEDYALKEFGGLNIDFSKEIFKIIRESMEHDFVAGARWQEEKTKEFIEAVKKEIDRRINNLELTEEKTAKELREIVSFIDYEKEK